MLAEATGATTDRAGRVVVQPDLSLPNNPDIYVIGDTALPWLTRLARASSTPVALPVAARLVQ